MLAQELYHILANATRHTRFGITKKYYGPLDLTLVGLLFRPQDINAMQEGRLKELLASDVGGL